MSAKCPLVGAGRGSPPEVQRDNGGMSQTRSGYTRSVSGLAGAIVMSLLLIASIWALSRFQHRDPADPAPPVDYLAPLAAARGVAPFDVLAPAEVPAGWQATSTRWVGEGEQMSWHLGFLTAPSAGEYVGLDQGTAAPQDIVAATTSADQPNGSVKVGGVAWSSLVSSDGNESALVLRGDGVTTVVSGTASESVLQTFAGSLSAD